MKTLETRSPLPLKRYAFSLPCFAALVLCFSRLASAQVVSATIPFPPTSATNSVRSAVNDSANHTYYINNDTLFTLDGDTNAVTQKSQRSLIGSQGQLVKLDINTSSHELLITGLLNCSGCALPGLLIVKDPVGGKDGSVPIGQFPYAAAQNEVTNTIYVADYATNSIGVVSYLPPCATCSNQNPYTVTATIQLPERPIAIAVDSTINKIYAIADLGSSLYEIDGVSQKVKTIATEGTSTVSMAVNPSTHEVFVVNQQAPSYWPYYVIQGSLAVVDGAAGVLLTTRFTGANPTMVALDTDQDVAYVLNSPNHPTMYGLDGPTVTIIASGKDDYWYSVIGPEIPLASPNSDGVIQGAAAAAPIVVNSLTHKAFTLIGDAQNAESYAVVVSKRTDESGLSAYWPAAIPIDHAGLLTVNPSTNTIDILSATPDTSLITVIDGTGGSMPKPTIFPDHLHFRTITNVPSDPQTVYLANTGGAPMTLVNLEYNSPYFSDLVQQNDCPAVFPPFYVCPISIVMTSHSKEPFTQFAPFYAEEGAPAYDLAVVNINNDIYP